MQADCWKPSPTNFMDLSSCYNCVPTVISLHFIFFDVLSSSSHVGTINGRIFYFCCYFWLHLYTKIMILWFVTALWRQPSVLEEHIAFRFRLKEEAQLASCIWCFLASLTLWPLWRRSYVPSKCRAVSKLLSYTTQKALLLIVTAVRTQIQCSICCFHTIRTGTSKGGLCLCYFVLCF